MYSAKDPSVSLSKPGPGSVGCNTSLPSAPVVATLRAYRTPWISIRRSDSRERNWGLMIGFFFGSFDEACCESENVMEKYGGKSSYRLVRLKDGRMNKRH